MNGSKARAIIIIVFSFVLFSFEFALYSFYFDPPPANLTSILYHDSIKSWRFWLTSPYYPPFWDYFWHLFILLFGPRYVFTSIANAVFIVLGAVFVYLLLRNERVERDFCATGFALALLSPAALHASIFTRAESMMWLLLIGFIYFLVKSKVFVQIKNAVFAAIFASLGLLSKWSFFGYSFLPALVESLTPARSAGKKLIGLLAFALTGLILCGPWYLGVMELDRILPSATNDPSLPTYSFLGMLQFNFNLINTRLWGSFLMSASLVLIVFALAFSKAKTLWLLVCSIVGALVFFSIPVHSEERYLWPLIPVISAATAFSASSLFRFFKYKAIVPFLLLVLALANSVNVFKLRLSFERPLSFKLATNIQGLPRGTYEKFHQFLLRSLDYTKKPSPYISVFPPLSAEHLRWGYPYYLRLISPKSVPYEMAHYDSSVYWEFQRELRSLAYDAIIMLCNKDGNCEKTFYSYLQNESRSVGTPYFQPGMKLEEIKIVDATGIIEDFKFIVTNYKPVDSYEALSDRVLVMWVKQN